MMVLDDYVTVYPTVYHGVREAVTAADPGTRQEVTGGHSSNQLHSE